MDAMECLEGMKGEDFWLYAIRLEKLAFSGLREVSRLERLIIIRSLLSCAEDAKQFDRFNLFVHVLSILSAGELKGIPGMKEALQKIVGYGRYNQAINLATRRITFGGDIISFITDLKLSRSLYTLEVDLAVRRIHFLYPGLAPGFKIQFDRLDYLKQKEFQSNMFTVAGRCDEPENKRFLTMLATTVKPRKESEKCR
jgi:hypothetical protein